MKQYVFGIDIGGTSIKCGLFTADGELLDKWEIMTDRTNGGENVPKDIAKAIDAKMKEKFIEKDSVLGVGVGIPGIASPAGVEIKCTNMGWNHVPFREEFNHYLNKPVHIANDADVAALGESIAGVSAGTSSSVFITIGTGIGSGIIINNRIWNGFLTDLIPISRKC